MISVNVNDSALIAAMLSEVVKIIDTASGLDLLLEQGCDPVLLDTLRNAKARDIRETASRLKSIRLTFSSRELAAELHKLQLVREDQEMCEYFIRHGANRTMVTELWKMSIESVAQMRRVLLPGGGNVGRPPLPRDHAVREAVHRAWTEILKAHPDESRESRRRRIFLLHKQYPDMTIDTLYSVVTEFDPVRERVDRRARRNSTAACVSVFPMTAFHQAGLVGGNHAAQ
ncbi:Protein of unknown function [Variovorax sp. HW608]|nr:Protein of unknown function [Variovorax sp. HW608]